MLARFPLLFTNREIKFLKGAQSETCAMLVLVSRNLARHKEPRMLEPAIDAFDQILGFFSRIAERFGAMSDRIFNLRRHNWPRRFD